MSGIAEKQELERAFWRDCKDVAPGTDSLDNVINKVTDAAVFVDCVRRHESRMATTGRILELGGGQGWAACVYKRLYPDAHVTTTDLSDLAVLGLPQWERLFNVKLDHAYACASYDTREADESVDQVFCFAAAHHFLAHSRTLRELFRVLKPGGKAFYFHEPTSPRWLYPLAFRRVNKKRPDVPEDVLIPSELGRLARQAGLQMDVAYYPSVQKRGPIETVYYAVLSRVTVLQHILPCSANFVFTKPTRPAS